MTSKVVTFGEVMLRLASPGFERFLQSPHFEATFGGGEANVAAALAAFGLQAAYVTVLPENNPISDAAIAELRRLAVDVSAVVRGKGRFGIYYLEPGANQRPSRVVYDREYSAMALAKPGDIAWERIFEGARWFHMTGITPAVSASAADLALESVRKAQGLGLTVSCDLNYRKNLWKWGKSARAVMPDIVRSVDVVIANEEDVQMALGLDAPAQGFRRPQRRICDLIAARSASRLSRNRVHSAHWTRCTSSSRASDGASSPSRYRSTCASKSG